MDKDVMKRLLRDADIPIGKFLVLRSGEKAAPFASANSFATATPFATANSFANVTAALGCPFFLKPANMGSSVGVCKIHNEAEYHAGLTEAFQYDTKVVLEEFIRGREIECAVLGNENPQASVPGEIISSHEFYSYDAKYLDEKGAVLEIPAKIPDAVSSRIQALTIKTFQTLCCEGLSRVDFFLKDNGEVIVNEINTLPGFTKISMYPKLWEASGISYTELIDKLIQLAIQRFEKERNLKTSFV
jgi:D-alanine-D-alanine ligase